MYAFIQSGTFALIVDWYKVVFGLGNVERREAVNFIEDFGSVLRAAGYAPNVALLHLREEPRFQSTYYLTPAAAEGFGTKLEKYMAMKVDAPDPLLVYLAVGSEQWRG